MDGNEEEERQLRSAALQTANSILLLRHRAERELRETRDSLQLRTDELDRSLAVMRATLESTTDAILVTDRVGEITGYNRKFCEMWNLPPEIMEPRQHGAVLERNRDRFPDPEEFLRRVNEIYAVSPEASDDVLELSDGRVIERFSRIQVLNGENAGRVWSFRDITEQRRVETERERLLVSEREARERAERETRMKDEFFATLSHELRTPLNAILGWTHILREIEVSGEIAEAIEVIDRNAHAQAAIIEDLLDMSRIISGKVRLEITSVDLAELVRAAVESVEPLAAQREIQLETKIDARAGTISGDPTRLQQVLWNLLTNALKFTPAHGRVEVILARVTSHIEISITDTGEGITPDFLPHVFDRFRQADASSTRRHRGLGLGLAIVKNLVEIHGGEVRAASAGPNHGATFTVALPLLATVSEETLPGPATPATPLARADLAGISVLVVDDEEDARQLLQRVLRDAGAAVMTAPSAAHALTCLETTPPDILVSDIGLPEEDGCSLIQRLRAMKTRPVAKIPAIALTAFARAEDRGRALASGFDVHLTKPVHPSELARTVARLAGRETD